MRSSVASRRGGLRRGGRSSEGKAVVDETSRASVVLTVDA